MIKNLYKIINYLFIKISLIPLNLWLISSLVFILLRIAPGDPVDAILGSGADKNAREILRSKLGLNDSLFQQYINYVRDLIHLDFGAAHNAKNFDDRKKLAKFLFQEVSVNFKKYMCS